MKIFHSSVLEKISQSKIIIPLLLLFIMTAGFLVRFDDLRAWHQEKTQTFYNDRPLLTTFDGYFYLNLARDLLRDEYSPIDEKQKVPMGRPRPMPPPLLSVLGASVTALTGATLDMVGTLMPAVLGVLIAIPLYLLGGYYGGRIMGLMAAAASLFFPYYVYRSNIGWFDTDCMNVTFATLLVYCTVQFSRYTARKRYLYGGLVLLVYILFLWWWDQAGAVVSVIFCASVAVSLLFFYRPERSEGKKFFLVMALLIGIALLWKGSALPQQIWHSLEGYYNYIYTSKSAVDVFPNQSITVSEQVRPGFNEIVTKSTGSMYVFFAAAIGLLLLFIKRPKESLFLSVPLVLASLSFLFAKRFLIFLNPLTALGLGSFISILWGMRTRHVAFGYCAPVMAALLLWPNIRDNINRVHWPKEPAPLVAGMAVAEHVTPDDAVVWAWWDHGYNMRYWSDRGVISDGSYHSGDISLYNAYPLTRHSEAEAAHFMYFYVSQGAEGMERLYKAFSGDHDAAFTFLEGLFSQGPGQFSESIAGLPLSASDAQGKDAELLQREFYFPRQTRPVYLFLDWRLTVTSYWWFWFGSWDFAAQKGQHPYFELYQGVNMSKGMITGRGRRNGFQADVKTGMMRLRRKSVPLATIRFFEPGKPVQERTYDRPGPLLEVSKKTRAAALVDPDMADSVFNKLFVRGQFDPRYFKLIDEGYPAWQLWKVEVE